MASPLALTTTQFSEALTREGLQGTRLIHVAIMTGPVLFLLVVIAFSLQQAAEYPPAASDVELMNILSMVHGVLFLLAVLLAQFLSGALFSPERLGSAAESASPETLAVRCVALQRAANIVRLAVLEGASLFGTAVCFIGVANRVVQAEPSYWLNAVSTGLFLVHGVTIFPTRQSFIDWFEARFVP